LAVGAVTDRLTLSRDESKVLEFIDNIRCKQERKVAAARMMQNGWRAYVREREVYEKKHGFPPPEQERPQNRILNQPVGLSPTQSPIQSPSHSTTALHVTLLWSILQVTILHSFGVGCSELSPMLTVLLVAQRYYKAALDYAQMRGETVNGISTDVALTVTENAVLIRKVNSNLEDLDKKMAEMHNMIKTAVLGGASTKSTRW